MKTAVYPSIEGGGFARTLIANTFNKMLSNHMKRLVFISSLVGLVYQVKDADMKVITKLNNVFKLADHAEAMQLPVRVKSVIWKDKDLNVLGKSGKVIHLSDVQLAKLEKEDVERLSTQVASQAPWWLKYSDYEAMKADVVKLFLQIQSNPKLSLS